MHMQTPRRRPLTMNLLALSLLACMPVAWAGDAEAVAADAAAPAQDTPSATPQQAQALPEPQMAGQASFVLQGVRFTGVSGATNVPEAELQAAVAGKIGQSVTFSDLEQLAARASAVYRKHGYALVQVFVPVQEVVDGQVTFNVSEGSLGNVSIEVAEGAPVQQERVAKTLAVLEPGKPLNGQRYERAMLLLSDLPGIKPQSAISAGAVNGTTDLTVKVGQRDRIQYGLELDNFGSRDSGRHRITGSLRWASPFERGDNLDDWTLLPVRSGFVSRLETAVSAARNGGPAFSVLCIEFDREALFGSNHDDASHARTMVDLTEGLRAGLRTPHMVARLGGARFGVLLDVFGSAISFHSRYQRSREIPALLEHVVLNCQNPRSLAWVAQTLNGRLAYLHEREAVGVDDLSKRLRQPDVSALATLCESDAIGDFVHLQDLLREMGDTAGELSDAIALRYFSHTEDARRSLGA